MPTSPTPSTLVSNSFSHLRCWGSWTCANRRPNVESSLCRRWWFSAPCLVRRTLNIRVFFIDFPTVRPHDFGFVRHLRVVRWFLFGMKRICSHSLSLLLASNTTNRNSAYCAGKHSCHNICLDYHAPCLHSSGSPTQFFTSSSLRQFATIWSPIASVSPFSIVLGLVLLNIYSLFSKWCYEDLIIPLTIVRFIVNEAISRLGLPVIWFHFRPNVAVMWFV